MYFIHPQLKIIDFYNNKEKRKKERVCIYFGGKGELIKIKILLNEQGEAETRTMGSVNVTFTRIVRAWTQVYWR